MFGITIGLKESLGLGSLLSWVLIWYWVNFWTRFEFYLEITLEPVFKDHISKIKYEIYLVKNQVTINILILTIILQIQHLPKHSPHPIQTLNHFNPFSLSFLLSLSFSTKSKSSHCPSLERSRNLLFHLPLLIEIHQ